MTNVYPRKRTITHHEQVIPCDTAWGAPVIEVQRAIEFAMREYEAQNGGASPGYDDWCRLFVEDDAIVVRFTVEAKQ